MKLFELLPLLNGGDRVWVYQLDPTGAKVKMGGAYFDELTAKQKRNFAQCEVYKIHSMIAENMIGVEIRTI